MHKYWLCSALTLGTLLSACGSQIDDLKDQKSVSSVAYTESNGVVAATLNSAAATDQVLVASPNSNVADVSILVPPGALSISTAISLGEATDQSTAVLTELGVTTVGQPGTPVYIGTSTGNPPNATIPLTIKLPLPLGDLNAPAGLIEAATESKLVLIYVVYQDGWKSGIIPLNSESFIGAFLKQAVNGFGYFQIVYLATPVSGKVASSAIVPGLTTKTAGNPEVKPETDPVRKAVIFTGDASGFAPPMAILKDDNAL